MVTLRPGDASPTSPTSPNLPNLLHRFQPMDPRRALKYRHQTGSSTDYSVQPLLPYELSAQGPPMAVADVNGDGLDDVFIGGGAGVPGKLLVQRKDGSFVGAAGGQPSAADTQHDDFGV